MKHFKFFFGQGGARMLLIYPGNTMGEALDDLIKNNSASASFSLRNLTHVEEMKEKKSEVWAGNVGSR